MCVQTCNPSVLCFICWFVFTSDENPSTVDVLSVPMPNGMTVVVRVISTLFVHQEIITEAVYPYLQCGSGKQCPVLPAINDVCESILVACFHFFGLFCFDP